MTTAKVVLFYIIAMKRWAMMLEIAS